MPELITNLLDITDFYKNNVAHKELMIAIRNTSAWLSFCEC